MNMYNSSNPIRSISYSLFCPFAQKILFLVSWVVCNSCAFVSPSHKKFIMGFPLAQDVWMSNLDGSKEYKVHLMANWMAQKADEARRWTICSCRYFLFLSLFIYSLAYWSISPVLLLCGPLTKNTVRWHSLVAFASSAFYFVHARMMTLQYMDSVRLNVRKAARGICLIYSRSIRVRVHHTHRSNTPRNFKRSHANV